MPKRYKPVSQSYRVKAADRSSPSTFDLLNLPAEVRNLIYEYALTAPEGLRIQWQVGIARRRKKPVTVVDSAEEKDRVPINNLQYTNRQLHKETAGLEIQYNRITFTAHPSHKIKGPAEGLMRFHGSMTTRHRLWLRHVVLEPFGLSSSGKEQSQEERDALHEPFSWLRQHWKMLFKVVSFAHSQAPNMRIDLHIPGFSLPKAGEKLFSQHAIILSRLFRATDFRKHERSPNSNDLLDGICREWLGDRYFEKLQGIKVNNNLRILPEEYLWPVAGGRHHTGTEPPVPIRRTKYVMEAHKSINLMQRWYSEGI
jgi:hypothetical protein